MDFDGGGGIGGGFGYGNGYTPLANQAIANNNANYWGNQAYASGVGAYDPFAQSGGFGNQTAYYAGLGADYSRAGMTGNVFGPIGGGGGGSGGLATLPGGGVDPNDPGNIAKYYEIMNGGRGQLARTMQQNMMPQAPVQQGGGLGSSGFGPYGGTGYTGQPGYGLGIGATGAGGVNVGNTFGTSGQNPSFGGSPSYGYGGFPGSLSNDLMPPQPNETPNIRPWLGS